MRYAGDPVAAALAVDKAAAEEVLALIDVEYEELPAVTNIEEAIAPGGRGSGPEEETSQTVSGKGTELLHLRMQAEPLRSPMPSRRPSAAASSSSYDSHESLAGIAGEEGICPSS